MKASITVGVSVLTCLSIIHCNSDKNHAENSCTIAEISSHYFKTWMDSSQRVESLVDELYKVTRFDTLFILPPYTSKDSIQHYLNCYHKNSDLISHDDEFNLIVIRKAEILEYIYLKRGGCTFGEISRWYGSHLQVEKD